MRFVNLGFHLKASVILLCCFVSFAFGQKSGVSENISDSFSKYDIVQIESDSVDLAAGNPSKLRFSAAGQNISISLVPHDIRTLNYRAENTGFGGLNPVERAPVNTFSGTVNGDTRSISRINILNSQLEGFFTSKGIRYFIEPASSYLPSAAANEYIVYRPEDVVRNDQFSCGSKLSEKIEYGRELTKSSLASSPTAVKRIEIATEADFEYVNTLGSVSQANAEILGILNTVDGLYQSDLNLAITVSFQHTWTAADPFAGPNTEFVVRNFAAYWNSNFPLATNRRDAAHLFSGKSNVLSQGWAYIGVICRNQSAAYGMSGYINWSPGKYLITAHEIGHNLGANHAESAQSCGSSLMNAQLSGSTPLSFCQYSRDEITNYVNANSSCLTSRVACAFDFDGDNKTDISIFRPGPGEWWYSKSSTGGNAALQFGTSTDKLAPGDFTGDGATDIAFWRPSNGSWYILRSEDFSFLSFPFGANGDVPVPADYDADGKADAAVFRPSTNTWFISNSGGSGTTIATFGIAGDQPVPADYDGDGKADIAIFRPGPSEWWISRSTAGLTAFQFGTTGDKTVSGDYTGDGKADVAFFRPSTGFWFILRSEDSSFLSFPWGANGDLPAPGDYDGDGKFDATVFRPSTNTWFANRSSSSPLIATFGIANDVPVPGAFVK